MDSTPLGATHSHFDVPVAHNYYLLYGLLIRSEIPLPAHAADSFATPDLDIIHGEPTTVPFIAPAGEVLAERRFEGGGFVLTRTDNNYVFRFFGLAEFRFSLDRSRVSAHSCLTAPSSHLTEFLVSTVPALILLMSGKVVLHASAVAKNGRAVGILAHSGGGKSTLAALLCKRGCELVTDDVLVVDWITEQAYARLGPNELRLRLGSFALEQPQPFPFRPTGDKRVAIRPPTAAARPQLVALVAPVLRRATSQMSVERVEGTEAFAAIVSYLRTTTLFRMNELSRSFFTDQARLSRTVPIYRVSMPSATPLAVANAVATIDALLESGWSARLNSKNG